MDQCRPAKPDEILNVLQETDTNKNSAFQNKNLQRESQSSQATERNSLKASVNLILNSLEASLSKAKERRKDVTERKRRLEK